MNIRYIIARLARKYMPNQLFEFILQKGIGVKPGIETTNPKEATLQYMRTLKEKNFSIEKKRVLLFGYGGNFGVSCLLLEAGASHVVLVDKYAQPNNIRNKTLFSQYTQFLIDNGEEIIPNPKFITLYHDDVEKLSDLSVDLVLSNSVLEHIQDVDTTVRALAGLTDLNGIQIHFIDLRDHYFKYPFEMLCYTETVWQKWLNPSSYLNRYRMLDYQRVFKTYFTDVEIIVLERNIDAFQRVQSRVRKEFLSGVDEIDSVTAIQAIVREVRR